MSTDAAPIAGQQLGDAVAATSRQYKVQADDSAVLIAYADIAIAHVDINTPGDGLFDEEREELIEFARGASGDEAGKMRVLSTLENATTIVAAQVLFGTGNAETTLTRLDPLWAWLFNHRTGLLQADAEGYYDRGQLLLAVR